MKDIAMTNAVYTVYTDGACAPTNPGPCAWGAVLVADGQALEQRCNFLGHGTNNIAEITAALKGLLMTPPGAIVDLYSDSQYTLKGISEWRAGWERKNWITSDRKPVKNKELWISLFAEIDKRTVRTHWVRGHNGDKFNEVADGLANRGLTMPLGGPDYVVSADPAVATAAAAAPRPR